MPVLGGLADGVDEADLRARMSLANGLDEGGDFLERLGCLRDDAEFFPEGERCDVFVGEDDREVLKVSGEAANFHVISCSDDDGEVSGDDEPGEGGRALF